MLGHMINCAWFGFFFFLSEIAKLPSMAAVPSPLPNLVVQLFALLFWLLLACVRSVSPSLGAAIWGDCDIWGAP